MLQTVPGAFATSGTRIVQTAGSELLASVIASALMITASYRLRAPTVTDFPGFAAFQLARKGSLAAPCTGEPDIPERHSEAQPTPLAVGQDQARGGRALLTGEIRFRGRTSRVWGGGPKEVLVGFLVELSGPAEKECGRLDGVELLDDRAEVHRRRTQEEGGLVEHDLAERGNGVDRVAAGVFRMLG